MKITNPTDQEVSIMIKGTTYVAGPGETVDGLTEEEANFWLGTHAFLQKGEVEIETEPEEEKAEEPEKKTKTKK